MKTKVTIIGFGIMGKAIEKALTNSDKTIEIVPVDVDQNHLLDEVSDSDFVIIAVKPQNTEEVLEQIKNYLSEQNILISIMAGVTIKKLVSLSQHNKVIRMMPNLGLSVGEGIAAWKSEGLSTAEVTEAKNFIDKITDNFEVSDEDTINKVTAISGSGPAYFFLLADSLLQASGRLGLTEEEGKKLVHKTFKAAAALSKEANYNDLIAQVASKGGTTEAALKVFQEESFSQIVEKAVQAAYKRAGELNK